MKPSTTAVLINLGIILVLGSIGAIVFGACFGDDPLDMEPEVMVVVEKEKPVVRLTDAQRKQMLGQYGVYVQDDPIKAQEERKRQVEAERRAKEALLIAERRKAERERIDAELESRLKDAERRREEHLKRVEAERLLLERKRKEAYAALVEEQMKEIPDVENSILAFCEQKLPNTSRRVVDDYILLKDDCADIRATVGGYEKPVYDAIMGREVWKGFLVVEGRIKAGLAESEKKKQAWDDWCKQHQKKIAEDEKKRVAAREKMKAELSRRKAERERKIAEAERRAKKRIEGMFDTPVSVTVNP